MNPVHWLKPGSWAAGLALALAAGLGAQTPPPNPPGRIQLTFAGLEQRAAEVSDVSLDGPMLQLGLRMLAQQQGGGAAAQVLAPLQGVYVKSLRFDASGEYSESDLAGIQRQLQVPGWSHILSVHSRREHRRVDVFVMKSAQGVAGMAIIAEYPTEVRVVNLVGPIDPAALGQLGGHFGIPQLPKNGSDHDKH